MNAIVLPMAGVENGRRASHLCQCSDGKKAPATIVNLAPPQLNCDVRVVAFGLKKSNSGDHGRYHHDFGQGVRKHVLHDVFRRLRKFIARDEDPHLLF
jgi:hypothetical protein